MSLKNVQSVTYKLSKKKNKFFILLKQKPDLRFYKNLKKILTAWVGSLLLYTYTVQFSTQLRAVNSCYSFPYSLVYIIYFISTCICLYILYLSYCCNHKQKESSGGIQSLFITKVSGKQ